MAEMNREEAADLMTTGDVAQLGECGPEAVRVWHRTGRLPAILTAGGQRLFRRGDVTKFLADRAAQKAARKVTR